MSFVFLFVTMIGLEALIDYRYSRLKLVAFEAWRANRTRKVLTRVGLLILLPLVFHVAKNNIQRASTLHVQSALQQIAEDLMDTPAGVEGGKEFLRRLKTVNTTFAPDDVRHELDNYIKVIEQSVQAAKTDNDPTVFKKRISEQYQKLKSVLAEYE